MKKLLILISLFLLTSCGKVSKIFWIFDKEIEVVFDACNGSLEKEYIIERGTTIDRPEDPINKDMVFVGWYTSDGFLFDFNEEVEDDITLKAKYQETTLTYDEIEYSLRASVIVETKSYDEFLFIETSSEIKTGSGVIFHEQDGKYYALTNNHVALKDDSYSEVEYTVYDCYGNEYEATNYFHSSDYDLAVVCFEKEKELEVIKRADSNPGIHIDVIAIGQPNGNINTISYGSVLKYNEVSLKDATEEESNVDFPVIVHDAFIDSGSSGGPLLNSNLELIGINYAVGESFSGNIRTGYAVPINRVDEFLNYYVWE